MELLKADKHDMKIDVGTILKKGKKEYIVVGWDILMEQIKVLHLVRKRITYMPAFLHVINVYDNDINKYCIVKY